MAKILREIAQTLEDTAEKMDRHGLITLNVRCGKGAMTSLTKKLVPFAQNAKRKLNEHGIR